MDTPRLEKSPDNERAKLLQVLNGQNHRLAIVRTP
jgi:hypothetical protein